MHAPSALRLLVGVLALSTPILGLPSTSYAVFEKMAAAPAGWVALPAPVDPAHVLSLRIHLAQQNEAAFEQQLLAISTPGHARYGAHMTAAEVRSMLQPRESAVQNVLAWLEAHELRDRADVALPWVSLKLSVAEAEALLQTKYSYFWNADQASVVVRTLDYSLPAALHGDVALVQPTNMFGFQEHRSTISQVERLPGFKVGATALNTTACNDTITPTCLAELYGFDSYEPKGLGWLGVSGYLNQSAQFADLESFLDTYKPSMAGTNFSVVSINGGTLPQSSSIDPNDAIEANLDIQYTVSISAPIPNTFFTAGGSPPFVPDVGTTTDTNEPYLDQLTYLLAQDTVPTVLSTSYGESEQTVPLSYRTTVCNMFAQLGARGTSVVFSSGDSGPGSECLSNDGTNSTKFLPTFPAGCPWVTSVGATHYVEPEQAISFSSGGFSETWAAPDYQADALAEYFSDHAAEWQPFAAYFNKTGRGIPDVAAQGSRFHVTIDGTNYLVGGTSASCPTFAAVISLVNDKRLAENKTSLGFLNPALYKNAKTGAFTDITAGTSTGCEGYVPNAGWAAVTGWDPSTGLGTPNFEKMAELL